MKKFDNSKTKAFLESIPELSLESKSETLTARCKFNFSYFCKQDAGQNFDEWTHAELVRLLQILSNFSREPLSHWEKQPRGKGTTLAIYNKFPPVSDFNFPKHVPHDVCWGRFRLTGAVRLVGFTVPARLSGRKHDGTGVIFDCNTFYIVFLDREHRFWKTEAN